MKTINRSITKQGLIRSFEILLCTIMLMGGGYITIVELSKQDFEWALGWIFACLLMGYCFSRFSDDE